VPSDRMVRCDGVYPGIDLLYYGRQRKLEFDFVLSPGANPNVIKLGFEGVERISLDATGAAILQTGGGEIALQAPAIYQQANGEKRAVPGKYVLAGEHQIRFQMSSYDKAKPLVIDPVLSYSTYLGGSDEDFGLGMATDNEGNAYITGETLATDFPLSSPLQGGNRGDFDVFVSKLDPSGTRLVYSTYLGGFGDEHGLSVAVDSEGNAYVTGQTFRRIFPSSMLCGRWLAAGRTACHEVESMRRPGVLHIPYRKRR
jgi:Beta-propeller repeat